MRISALMVAALCVAGPAQAGGPVESIIEPAVEPAASVMAERNWTGFYAGVSAVSGTFDNGLSKVGLTAIEAYPSACYPSARKEGSAMIGELRGHFPALEHEDHEDALTCALIAYLFTTQQDTLVQPESNVPSNEGWIWLPRDAIHPKISRKNRLEKLPTGDRL